MVRHPARKEEEDKPQQPDAIQENAKVEVVERVVNLALLNDKLNYITGLLHKVAEACEVNLED